MGSMHLEARLDARLLLGLDVAEDHLVRVRVRVRVRVTWYG